MPGLTLLSWYCPATSHSSQREIPLPLRYRSIVEQGQSANAPGAQQEQYTLTAGGWHNVDNASYIVTAGPASSLASSPTCPASRCCLHSRQCACWRNPSRMHPAGSRWRRGSATQHILQVSVLLSQQRPVTRCATRFRLAATRLLSERVAHCT